MKVVVCIKQVPDTKGGVEFNPDGTLNRAAMLAIMNPDDKAGLEAALRLKDQYGAEVTVVTMGLPKAEDVLREALAMGADNAILVTDRVLGGADTWATSQTLAGAIRNLELRSDHHRPSGNRRRYRTGRPAAFRAPWNPGNFLYPGAEGRGRQRYRKETV